ncbi:MAG TPA: orotidine 5'-phosphate decarboxylase / HUMPS family protein, partial [Vicinamibacterales bacterium]
RAGVTMLNVHAAGGTAMMRAAAEAATKAATDFGVARPICIAVTVLTSLDRKGLSELGVTSNVEAHVLRLAELALEAGLDGCVASPQEIALVRRALGPKWLIVTPGIRPATPSDKSPTETARHDASAGTRLQKDDQMRTATPSGAIRAGADAIVVGRPITAAPDPHAAAAAILSDIAR